jgi:hydroxyethylthiazole kinase-like uncharacterized protein yjeF
VKVCTSRQMAAIDRETIDGGVPGLELMERAGEALTAHLLDFLAEHEDGHAGGCADGCCGHDHEGREPGVLIVCGKGNNGGDGLVMARLAALQGAAVQVLMLAPVPDLSPDAQANHERLPDAVQVWVTAPDEWAAAFRRLAERATVVVDAVFGTGVTPPLRAHHADLFRAMNDAGLPCLAVDIPSGVDGDDGRVDPVAVAADLTVTVGLPKRGLLLAPGRDFTGDIEVVDIGFADEVCARHTDDLHWRPREDYLTLLPPRSTSSHKYQCGRLLVMAGSRAYGGAAHLAGLGGLRSGAGLVTVAAPAGLETALRVGLPEALIAPLAETAAGTLAPPDAGTLAALTTRQDAVALGPGLGADAETDRWVVAFLRTAPRELPVVLDADGLNAFARQGEAPAGGGRPLVLTPHAGEFARLTGLAAADIAAEPWRHAAEWARRWQAVVVLKGSPTFIAGPDGAVHINPSGDDALARGGSGDVLTGLIGGLLAQGARPLDAALLGAYVHGLAGTRAAGQMSSRAVLVREMAAALGPVLLDMEREASGDAALRERIWPTAARREGDMA